MFHSAIAFLIVFVILSTAKNLYSASTWTEKSDTDFSGGIISSVTIVGTGDAAYIRISTVQATGGTITYSGGYTVHTFTSNGTFTPDRPMNVEYLVVAGGGGGGGGYQGGGGGAGGLLTNVGATSILVTAQAYSVVVGGGGRGAAGSGGVGPLSGGNSSAFGFTAIGGGNGGSQDATSGNVNCSGGGSGGGGNHSSGLPGGSGTAGQGNAGGNGYDPVPHAGGGGGGASAVGQNAPSDKGGNGGNGLQNSITGTAVYYAGGGGGSYRGSNTSTGGLGGGGNSGGVTGASGVPNTGGGGGAGRGADYGGSNAGVGGSGGSGIVIVRYLTATYFSTATYKSDVLDTASKVVVSSISWNPSTQPAGTNLAVSMRASKESFAADSPTPAWHQVSNNSNPGIVGRYIQYTSTFTTSVTTSTPRLEDITIIYKPAKPWQEKSVTRTSPFSFGFYGGDDWTWQVPVKGGTLVTISAYIRYNTEYQGGSYDKPKLTLSGLGINESISATSSAENSWELRQLSGTPSSDGILTLKAEGFSINPGGKFYIDDINISQ